MNNMVYRGVAHDGEAAKKVERIVSRPQMFYRGVEHNGVRTLNSQESVLANAFTLFYRGTRLA